MLLRRLIYNHEVINTTYIDHFISSLRGNQSTLEMVVDYPGSSCVYLHDYVMLVKSK